MSDVRKKETDSNINKHWHNEHEGRETEFQLKTNQVLQFLRRSSEDRGDTGRMIEETAGGGGHFLTGRMIEKHLRRH